MPEFLTVSTSIILLAYFSDNNSIVKISDLSGNLRRVRRKKVNSYGFYAILVILILFVGLRTSYNDTYSYIGLYRELETGFDATESLKWSLAENPGFIVSNILIKSVIGGGGQVVLFVCALITLTPFLFFYRRWSPKFWFSIYLFIASGMLLLSMAALKQVIAMGIGLCGVTCFLTNKKYLFTCCVFLAMTFHPFVFLYLSAFYLNERVWSKKVYLIVFGAILSGVFIERFLDVAYSVTGAIGAEYDKYEELSSDGVNLIRLIVYSVTPAIGFFWRQKINAKRDAKLILFVNLSLIGWCFMFIGLFTGANLLGRMAAYFDPFAHLALSMLLFQYIPKGARHATLLCCTVGYFVFMVIELYARDFDYHWFFSS